MVIESDIDVINLVIPHLTKLLGKANQFDEAVKTKRDNIKNELNFGIITGKKWCYKVN